MTITEHDLAQLTRPTAAEKPEPTRIEKVSIVISKGSWRAFTRA